MHSKVIIFSHERSGTHFLINSIAGCFGYDNRQIDLDSSQPVDWRNPAQAERWLRQFSGKTVSSIFKSHHAVPFFLPLLPALQKEYAMFYIERDGRDVMTSFWIYLNRLAPGWGPRTRTVGEFMRAVASGGITQYQYGREQQTMLQRWITHVEGWRTAALPVHRIRYEDLYNDFERVIEDIAACLQRPVARLQRPRLDAPSSLPWKGGHGNWQGFFTVDDEAYFRQQLAGKLYDNLQPG